LATPCDFFKVTVSNLNRRAKTNVIEGMALVVAAAKVAVVFSMAT
jgi:hypothetical protein